MIPIPIVGVLRKHSLYDMHEYLVEYCKVAFKDWVTSSDFAAKDLFYDL